MRGKRIDAAKKALFVMLRKLPHKESLFQIVFHPAQEPILWRLEYYVEKNDQRLARIRLAFDGQLSMDSSRNLSISLKTFGRGAYLAFWQLDSTHRRFKSLSETSTSLRWTFNRLAYADPTKFNWTRHR
ncbi:hypothetical protein B0H11DRAFT_2197810 [Mycena galericulata]|nr:hypothetical protein B0H11DRAFT_2197810 [Mycena galericulata]